VVYCSMHDECFIVYSLGLICPASQTLGLFCLHVGKGGGGGGGPAVVSLFATVATVIGQRIPDILKLIMMAPYSLN